MAFRALIIGFFALGSMACSRGDSSNKARLAVSASSDAPAASASGAVPATSAQPAVPPRPQHPAEQVLTAWNSALDRRDADKLASLYAPRVRFYGASKSSEDIIKIKKAAFGRMPDYRQRVENVRITKQPKGFEVRFDKYTSPKLDEKIAARLVLEPAEGDRLLIAEETDSVTDRRFKRAEPAICADAALSAVAGHPVVQKDIKRVERESRDAHPAGVVYADEAGKFEAAWGYMHPERFEPRWWVDVVSGQINARDALSDEGLAFANEERERVSTACSPPEADAGAKK
jgi:hypothetical protein